MLIKYQVETEMLTMVNDAGMTTHGIHLKVKGSK